MRFRFQEVEHRHEPVAIDEQLDVQFVQSSHSDVTHCSPIHVQLKLWYEAGMIRTNGTLQANVSFLCSRCTEPFTRAQDIAFHDAFFHAENTDVEDEEDVHPIHEDSVDLTPWMHEAFVLSLPFVPLCNEDCKGLCPVCGVNRNTQSCQCQTKRIDPRLMGLSDWLDQNDAED
jgi:uncharacterized protein